MKRIGPKTIAHLETPYWVHFWGRRHKCKPVFIHAIFGDGGQLLAVQPLNTRPQYYLVRVDSRWHTNGYEDGEVIHDHIDDIYEAIEEQVGRGGQLDADESPTGRARYADWPALNDDCGSCWWNATYLLESRTRQRLR